MVFQIQKDDSNYPKRLKEIPDPPKTLWGIGKVDILKEGPVLAMVGARECTPYGQKVAYELAKELAREGIILVSGMAYGIDAAAHRGTLAGFGRTIAVLGCGIDVAYPAEHQELKKEIALEGAVITELPPGTGASRWTFPRRNRIISGLSLGVIVVEAGIKSGSLITAEMALEQGRDVFAVPGPIHSPLSEGTHRLIQNGAKLVTSAKDVLDEIQGEFRLTHPLPIVSENRPLTEEDIVLELLSRDPQHMDELILSTGFPMTKISGMLVTLEIRGKISSLPGGRYIRN